MSGTLTPEIKNQIKITGYNPRQIDRMREEFILMCDDDLGIDIKKFQQLTRLRDHDAQYVFR